MYTSKEIMNIVRFSLLPALFSLICFGCHSVCALSFVTMLRQCPFSATLHYSLRLSPPPAGGCLSNPGRLKLAGCVVVTLPTTLPLAEGAALPPVCE